MTAQRAAFIEECQTRAPHSPDGGLLNRAAAYLIGDELALYDAFVAESAARREAERPDLTAQHRAELQQALAAATASRQSVETPQEQIDGERAGDGNADASADQEKAGQKTRKRTSRRRTA